MKLNILMISDILKKMLLFFQIFYHPTDFRIFLHFWFENFYFFGDIFMYFFLQFSGSLWDFFKLLLLDILYLLDFFGFYWIFFGFSKNIFQSY